MSNVSLDWNAIRPLNGSKANAFEELCAQLARAESPAGSRFERKGTPDAGVECYAILGDGSEWGWQAKYFDTLGDSQWPQLDASVKTAIEKHPRLVQYFVCIPLDRPDGRVQGRRSAKERWDEHVKKWTDWAAALGMTVEFVYWGSHELLERLAHSQHAGRLRFWFDVPGFDGAWFTARLDDALKTAGPRYTPEIHVGLPIAAELEAFGRTERFFDQIKARARGIRDKLRSFEYAESKCVEQAPNGAASAVSSKVQAILVELAAVSVQPVGALPFSRIAEQLAASDAAAEKLEAWLLESERQQHTKPPATEKSGATSPYRNNPFTERRYRIRALLSELQEAREALVHAEEVARGSLMLLSGAAGTGKTHLLCDVARQHVAANRPTVLLMGQQFVSAEAPWTQALQQLDLPGMSAEEFVGALESAAQVAGCRALVLIDAINEGTGRLIWPSHLAAFLAQLERSPWIGVLLTVRSSYEDIVVPEEVRARAVAVTHHGFADCEYDATRTFFAHYGLELPSTPLLAPEFGNPLFLKTLCSSLNANGERRLPRGFHGITAVFDLYLGAVNDRLASALGFNPKGVLVRRAVEVFAKKLLDSGERWLTLTTAEEVVNALLPGREFERSLYRGLVSEGVLVEEAAWRQAAPREEVVFIGYDRLADHLVAKMLLDAHLDADNPASAFAAGAPLAFVCDKSHHVPPGLLEALCVQIPERTGRELISLAPETGDRWGIGNAFRQSLVWRAITAFSEETRDVLNSLIRTEHDSDDTLDVLLTVATLPEHPFNARFLDHRLRRDSMPERDRWWSIYLHAAWRTHGAVDRLVDWASSVTPSTALDDETVNLCAITLSWMLTTSNRFLRDRVTKALVSLLTDRLDPVVRLIERFADVNDPYVAERLYAVAYGTAMRSHDSAEVGTVATCVYARVFASGTPPAHILLRDYARGVVERAIHLRANIDIVAERIRPPYSSCWPAIPTEDDIKTLLPDWSRGSHDSGDIEWARNRIGSSVMDDDFARYVIGTNFSSRSSNWLALRLDEPAWEAPERPEVELRALVAELSDDERKAWDTFDAAENELQEASHSFVADWFDRRDKDSGSGSRVSDIDALKQELEKSRPPEIAVPEAKREQTLGALDSALTKEHAERLERVFAAKEADHDVRRPPRFDLRHIQRYILRRVFDLGWTTERFGHFDRFSIGYGGREAGKAERIGKKYQWIAYHEIMALLADHFQYREQFREEEGDHAYEGPWQDSFRDLDPSCTLRATPGGTAWHGHSAAWWGAARHENWGDPSSPEQWVMRCDDLPKVEDLLSVVHPDDASRWLNLQTYFNWQQPLAADRESIDVERRELWYLCTGYLLRASDVGAFMAWGETVDFWGRWMPDPQEVHRMFLGEYGWSAAFRYFQQPYFGDDGWIQPSHGCPVSVRPAAFEYLREGNGFDCSVDESYTLRLPASELVTGLGLRWSANGADYLDVTGRLAAFDPTAHADGPSALLLRRDSLTEFLAREELAICWAVLGEKRVLGPGLDPAYYARLRISGTYMLSDKGPVGFLKRALDGRETERHETSSNPLTDVKT
ncbi:MAG: ATP-binding protein [Deltaproteobacteria bacterium]|nr:ATP-binding protein [Deltaproteobacteria bacterium]MBI3389824.1 ATP-binding protein [Deltaproteobacteria bacterium]